MFYNVVLVSVVQQSESIMYTKCNIIYIYIYIYLYPFFFRFFYHKGYYRILSRFPCNLLKNDDGEQNLWQSS